VSKKVVKNQANPGVKENQVDNKKATIEQVIEKAAVILAARKAAERAAAKEARAVSEKALLLLELRAAAKADGTDDAILYKAWEVTKEFAKAARAHSCRERALAAEEVATETLGHILVQLNS